MSKVQNKHALKVKLVDSDEKYQNRHAIKVKVEGGGGGTVIIDDKLSTTSENPVQNKVVTEAVTANHDEIGRVGSELSNKQDKLTAGSGISISADNVISASGGGDFDLPIEKIYAEEDPDEGGSTTPSKFLIKFSRVQYEKVISGTMFVVDYSHLDGKNLGDFDNRRFTIIVCNYDRIISDNHYYYGAIWQMTSRSYEGMEGQILNALCGVNSIRFVPVNNPTDEHYANFKVWTTYSEGIPYQTW